MNLRHEEIGIEFQRPAKRRFSVLTHYAAGHQRNAQTIKCDRGVWLYPGSATREDFSVGKKLCVCSTGPRLNEHKAERHQRIAIQRRIIDCLSIGLLSVLPTLLIRENIPEAV